MRCAVIFLMTFTAIVFFSIPLRFFIAPVGRLPAIGFTTPRQPSSYHEEADPSTPSTSPPEALSSQVIDWVSRQLAVPIGDLSVAKLRESLQHPKADTIRVSANLSCSERRIEGKYAHKNELPTTTSAKYVYMSTPHPRRGVVLLFHGCSHGGRDMCPASTMCPDCRGLPEEWTYVRKALNWGFDIIALTSTNRQSKCWATSRAVDTRGSSPVWNNRDVYHLLLVLRERNILYRSIPLIAMGASSGGQFVQYLPAVLGVQLVAVIAQIAAPPIAAHTSTIVIYNVMKRDSSTASHGKSMAKKRGVAIPSPVGQGVYDSSHRTGYYELAPLVMSESTLSDRIAGLPLTVSTAVYQALKEHGIADTKKGLTLDPRHQRGKWVPIVAKVLREQEWSDKLIADVSPIAEVMNVAYGYHEFFADHADVILRNIVQSY